MPGCGRAVRGEWRERDPLVAAGGSARHAGRKTQGGNRRTAKIEDHAVLIHAAIARQDDLTLDELRMMLAGHGTRTSIALLWRFFARHRITRKKKTAHASEQDRPDIVERRWARFEGQLNLDPERLVFIDESRA